jgi:hypothetical protein
VNCCVNKICWNITSKGLACVGQDEVILLVEVLPDETRIPKDLFIYINQLYFEAIKGNVSCILIEFTLIVSHIIDFVLYHYNNFSL